MQAIKYILYTVANSNAMNELGKEITYSQAIPYWVMGMILLDIFVVLCLGLWNLFVIRWAIKRINNEQ